MGVAPAAPSRRASFTSATVEPSPFGYCSVTRTGRSRRRKTRTSRPQLRAMHSNPGINGRNRSWTSTTIRAEAPGTRRLAWRLLMPFHPARARAHPSRGGRPVDEVDPPCQLPVVLGREVRLDELAVETDGSRAV